MAAIATVGSAPDMAIAVIAPPNPKVARTGSPRVARLERSGGGVTGS